MLDAGSPFSVPVSDTVDSTKVKCQGPGLGTNVRANIPQAFTVDASKAGVAPMQVRVQGPKGLCKWTEAASVELQSCFDWLIARSRLRDKENKVSFGNDKVVSNLI